MHSSHDVAGVTEQLASFVNTASIEDVPDSARHAARRALVNIVGCCVGGARHEIVEATADALLPFSGPAVASALGRQERTDILTAALLNGLSSAAYSFDDTHAETILHPSGASAAALLALAEQQPMHGEEFLLAFLLGIDVASRVSKAVSLSPASGDIGWSQTGIAAGIGAAAAAAKVMRLDTVQTTWAIGIAALQSSGFREAHGTMSATLIFGQAAQTGLRSAILARHGLSGPAAPLEGKYGFARLFSDTPHLPYLTDALGRRFEVESLAYKPYPCGVVIHPAVDAALNWYGTSGKTGMAIERVHLRTHPAAMALGFRRHPDGVLEAKVSLCHWVAVALAFGRAGLAEGQQNVIDHPMVSALRDLIYVESDAAMAGDAVEMTIVLKGGEQRIFSVPHAKGSVDNPMTDADLDEKFYGQVQINIPKEQATALLEQCWKVDQLNDVARIPHLARQ
ncbi:MmgE/PrpD family protein [Cupriavidus pinatubonensis]|uniref:MmgE/PrpD family protein n=1 Tax=Cupriavidus pinatubonensis TaxID=248026 RepID=UPI00112764F2|nr:MmgE/PrpD family protein [Cupriavidus pinatubonensis]TPQ26632.1 2-methylcitrate dehydratase [Cupriavidus pinatubonensis]